MTDFPYDHLVLVKQRFFEYDLTYKNIIGKTPLYADFMIWPWLERFEYIQTHCGFEMDTKNLQSLCSYIERMKQVPACRDLSLSVADHKRFYETYLNNEEADYDHGIISDS